MVFLDFSDVLENFGILEIIKFFGICLDFFWIYSSFL